MELLSAQCQSYWAKQDEWMGVIKLSMVKLTLNEFWGAFQKHLWALKSKSS